MDITDAGRLARQLLDEHGLRHWTFTFDNAKRRFGCCMHGRLTISLSGPITRLNDEPEVRDTILHEIAHALAGPEHGHDATWRAKAREIGARPERCAEQGTKVPEGRWLVRCPGCGDLGRRHRRGKRGAIYTCNACRQPVEWIDTRQRQLV